MGDELKVTQVDRDAAADLLESGGSKGILCRFDHAITIRHTDQLDRDPFVQAFARHRIATETQSQATIDELVEALKVIRHQWAGHSEACALTLQRGQCDCEWPGVAAQCDDAIAKAGGQS